MFVAATASSNFLRDELIGAVRAYAANGQNNQPLGDLYESTNGTLVAMSSPYYGRANVGGHLALVSVLVSLNCWHLGSEWSYGVEFPVCIHRWPRPERLQFLLDRRGRLPRVVVHHLVTTVRDQCGSTVEACGVCA